MKDKEVANGLSKKFLQNFSQNYFKFISLVAVLGFVHECLIDSISLSKSMKPLAHGLLLTITCCSPCCSVKFAMSKKDLVAKHLNTNI